jgi:hypothetical protein
MVALVKITLPILLPILSMSADLSAAELADPTKPPAYAMLKFRQAKLATLPKVAGPKTERKKETVLRLSSILISNNRKIAIIDDQMLSVGDKIRGARLVSITRDSVRLVRKGKTINLSLQSSLSAIKKLPAKSSL